MSNVKAWLGLLAVGCWSLGCGGNTTTDSSGGPQTGGGAGVGSGGGSSGDSSGASGSASTGGGAGVGVAGSTGAGTGGFGGTTIPIFDASVPMDASPVLFDASDCNCVPGTVLWGQNGGNVRYSEVSEVSPCKTYTRMRDYNGNAPPVTCKQELLGCGVNSIGIGDLTGALRNADVQQAVRAAPVLYGGDPRAFDGTVLRVVIGGAVVEIGTPCAGAAACKPIPPGVTALAEVLSLLDKQELSKPPCSTTFPQ